VLAGVETTSPLSLWTCPSIDAICEARGSLDQSAERTLVSIAVLICWTLFPNRSPTQAKPVGTGRPQQCWRRAPRVSSREENRSVCKRCA